MAIQVTVTVTARDVMQVEPMHPYLAEAFLQMHKGTLGMYLDQSKLECIELIMTELDESVEPGVPYEETEPTDDEGGGGILRPVGGNA